MPIIAIDYDGTYARFPEQFNELRKSFQATGSKVYIVTARCQETSPILDDLSAFDDVIYTCNKAKAAVIKADIFIDDNPITLCCDLEIGDTKVDALPASNLHHVYENEDRKWHWIHDFSRFVTEKIN